MQLFLFFLWPLQHHKHFFLFFSSIFPHPSKISSPQKPELHKSAWPASSVPRCLPLTRQKRRPFCGLWGGASHRLRAVIQQCTPLSAPILKRPIHHRESMEWRKGWKMSTCGSLDSWKLQSTSLLQRNRDRLGTKEAEMK